MRTNDRYNSDTFTGVMFNGIELTERLQVRLTIDRVPKTFAD